MAESKQTPIFFAVRVLLEQMMSLQNQIEKFKLLHSTNNSSILNDPPLFELIHHAQMQIAAFQARYPDSGLIHPATADKLVEEIHPYTDSLNLYLSRHHNSPEQSRNIVESIPLPAAEVPNPAPAESSLEKLLANDRQLTDKLTKIRQEQIRIQTAEEIYASQIAKSLAHHAKPEQQAAYLSEITNEETENISEKAREARQEIKSIVHQVMVDYDNPDLDHLSLHAYEKIKQSKLSRHLSVTFDKNAFQQECGELSNSSTLQEGFNVLVKTQSKEAIPQSIHHQSLDALVQSKEEGVKTLSQVLQQHFETAGVSRETSSAMIDNLKDDAFVRVLVGQHNKSSSREAVSKLLGNYSSKLNASILQNVDQSLIMEGMRLYEDWLTTHTNTQHTRARLCPNINPYEFQAILENNGMTLSSFRDALLQLPIVDHFEIDDYQTFLQQCSDHPLALDPNQAWNFLNNYQNIISIFQNVPTSPELPQTDISNPLFDGPIYNPRFNVIDTVRFFQKGGSPSSGFSTVKKFGDFLSGAQKASRAAKTASTVSTAVAGTATAPAWGTFGLIVLGSVVGIFLIYLIFQLSGGSTKHLAIQLDSIGGEGGSIIDYEGGFCDPTINPEECTPLFCEGNCLCPVHGVITQGPGGSYSHQSVNAIDIALTDGDPIYALTAGTVQSAELNSVGYGNLIIIDNDDGTQLYYAHLDSYMVIAGQHVEAGEQIGTGDNTGNSSGPHLHLEYRGSGVQSIINLFNFTAEQKAILNGCSNGSEKNCGGLSCSQ